MPPEAIEVQGNREVQIETDMDAGAGIDRDRDSEVVTLAHQTCNIHDLLVGQNVPYAVACEHQEAVILLDIEHLDVRPRDHQGL